MVVLREECIFKAGANGTAATAMAVPGFSQTLAPDFGYGWIVKKASR